MIDAGKSGRGQTVGSLTTMVLTKGGRPEEAVQRDRHGDDPMQCSRRHSIRAQPYQFWQLRMHQGTWRKPEELKSRLG